MSSEAGHVTKGDETMPTVNTPGAAAHMANDLLASMSREQVQTARSDESMPSDSSHLGENAKRDDVEKSNSLSASTSAPKTFWSYDPKEFFDAITASIPALKSDFSLDTFVSFNLSVQSFLSTIDSESFSGIIAQLGIHPTTNPFKFRLFETFILNQIQQDINVPEATRNYWAEFKKSKQLPAPISPSIPIHTPIANVSNSRGNFAFGGSASTPAKHLDFSDDYSPSTMKIPGRTDEIRTPKFFKDLGNTTGSLFSMLDAPNVSPQMPPMFATGENGQFQLMLNMQPAVTIVNPFPMLEICAKTHIPQFLLKYKVAKLSAPIGTSKSLKSCINPMLWPTVIKILTNPMISVDDFKAKTTDAEIYAALLKKYGAKTDDEAMLLLKSLEFKFDDSRTPQEQFLILLMILILLHPDNFISLLLRLFPQTQEFPVLTTFFEAEIIGPKYSFETNKWAASHETDQRHWSKFQAFNQHMANFASGSGAEAALSSDHDNVFTFMRWKELFLIPDHTVRVINGASFAGFYYCCYDATSCSLHGYYFHTGSELFQSLHLKPVSSPTSSSHLII
jgi:glucose-induced degradation protein 4